jgi:hypothetical protein
MIEHVPHPRITENKDWATVLFVLAFAIIAITKSVYENRFDFEFNFLINIQRFIPRQQSTKSSFTISLFIVQIISVAFFIQLSLSIFGYAVKTDWILFIKFYFFSFLCII